MYLEDVYKDISIISQEEIMEKRHLINPVRNLMMVVFVINMFLAVCMEESLRGVLTSAFLLMIDVAIYKIGRRFE